MVKYPRTFHLPWSLGRSSDDLLSIVTGSVEAYKICKERIDAVEKALEKALGEDVTTV